MNKQRGFTLIEAAVAIAVVAILSGIIIPLVVKNLQDAQYARAKNDVSVIAAALASQYKDTGTRPAAGGGPNLFGGGGAAADGSLQAVWGSGGTLPTNCPAIGTGNSFINLLTDANQSAAGNLLFGTTANTEFSYKGPYLAADVAAKSDPWGSRYVVLGYNATSQAASGPIWVICSGPDKSILPLNVTLVGTPTANIYPSLWTSTGLSADDLAVRVN